MKGQLLRASRKLMFGMKQLHKTLKLKLNNKTSNQHTDQAMKTSKQFIKKSEKQ
eukprot:TRINITY_DN585_c0_g1_i1.p1 TRINITY_DN585_c0_g1~~TRINITY_DN585_c0_g1_i1.p1  ORF type:complete len:54 (-),score=1.53 TRINITY_DN585_c0_g1_i1:93-254(-)